MAPRKVYLAISLTGLIVLLAGTVQAGTPNCPADTNGDGVVNVMDLTEVILNWGPCPGCGADTDGNDVVNVMDLTNVILGWGPCPPAGCIYHDDCAPDEYCAGDGCFDGSDWDGPLPEGVCTPQNDPADCAGEPVAPVCGCNYQFRLNACELGIIGDRWRNDGMCPTLSCPNGDVDCPPGFHCVGNEYVTQCLPE